MICLIQISQTAQGAFRADFLDLPGPFVEADSLDALLDEVRVRLTPVVNRTASTVEHSEESSRSDREEAAALAALEANALPDEAILRIITRNRLAATIGDEPGWDDAP